MHPNFRPGFKGHSKTDRHFRHDAAFALDDLLSDLALYFLFFLPGIIGLIYAGYGYAADSWRIGEHSTITSEGPPVYHFKTVIPIAGALIMLQGIAEIIRCIVCLKTGWPML